jgi:hypothetical protein
MMSARQYIVALLALLLLNVSIEPPNLRVCADERNFHVIENEINQIESIVEFVLEEGMDVEDAVPEADSPVDDESSNSPHITKRLTVWYFAPGRVPFYPGNELIPVYTNYALRIACNYVYNSRLLDSGLDIDSPPPQKS